MWVVASAAITTTSGHAEATEQQHRTSQLEGRVVVAVVGVGMGAGGAAPWWWIEWRMRW